MNASSLVLAVFLSLFAAQLVVETLLEGLNLRHTARAGSAVPAPLADRIDAETAQRSYAYTQARGRFGLFCMLFGAGVTLTLLFSGALPALERLLRAHGAAGPHLFALFLVALAAATSLIQLPASLYGTFVLEKRFGFNRTTPALWWADRAKGLALAAIIGIPLLYAGYGFFALAGPNWWLWLFGFLTTFQIAMAWLYPTLIAPLFNTFSPLPEGPLRERLEALARAADFRCRGLFVMDASRRSGHSNAYFTGFFRPRIVLFDTLLQQMSVEETAAVLAHEIGHYRARHIHKRLAFGLVIQLATLGILARLVTWPPLFTAFGFQAPSLHAALALASLCGGAFTFFFTPLESLVSRRHEYQADRFSVAVASAPDALASALVKLNGQNLSNLHPHPLYSAWHYSHPTLLERLGGIERARQASTPR